MPVSNGTKHDAGKSRMDLLPFVALEAVGHVLRHGADEYGEDNWRMVPRWRRRYIAAALRHLAAHCTGGGLLGGLPRDPKSGLPHLAHAVASLLFVLELGLTTTETTTEEKLHVE